MDCTKDDVIKRLRRIKGQIKGIERMIEKDECCNDILIQVAAARAALNKVGGIILENYSKSCIKKVANKEENDEDIDKLIDTIIKFTK